MENPSYSINYTTDLYAIQIKNGWQGEKTHFVGFGFDPRLHLFGEHIIAVWSIKKLLA